MILLSAVLVSSEIIQDCAIQTDEFFNSQAEQIECVEIYKLCQRLGALKERSAIAEAVEGCDSNNHFFFNDWGKTFVISALKKANWIMQQNANSDRLTLKTLNR